MRPHDESAIPAPPPKKFLLISLLVWLALVLFAVLSASCSLEDEGGDAAEVDAFQMQLVPIVAINEAYVTVQALVEGGSQYFLVRHDSAKWTWEWESCSNHGAPRPNSGIPGPGDYLDLVVDLNRIEEDTGAIMALQAFSHHPNCLTNRVVAATQATREIER